VKFFKSEQDLAAVVVKWFESNDFTTYKEVDARGGSVDIIATQGRLVVAVECKNSYSTQVMEQAWRWTRYAHHTFVAVPANCESSVLDHFAKDTGIGVLKVWGERRHDEVIEHIAPRLNREARTEHFKLFDDQKGSAAGSQSGGVITAYKRTIDAIWRYLAANGPKSMKEIVAEVKTHYNTPSSARSTLPARIESLHKDRFEIIWVGKKKLFAAKPKS
jgi:hypothetical protein